MTEHFLHYVWQYQQFNPHGLATTEKQPLEVIRTGMYNTHSGPDFSQARLVIGPMEWAGQVEIHLLSSDWEAHGHTSDPAYENVILHVVWEEDQPVYRSDGSRIPALELKHIVFFGVVQNYNNLLKRPVDIPCQPWLKACPDLIRCNMMDKAMAHRLEHKSDEILKLLSRNQNDWEQTTYQWMAGSFGFRLNTEAFLRLAEVLPLRLVQRHGYAPFQIEALVFGQAGFLDRAEDEYASKLAAEYHFMAHKYGIFGQRMQRHEWKFLRTRPSNFPSVRLSQWTGLLCETQHLFSFITETEDIGRIMSKFRIRHPEYWKDHYDFGKKSQRRWTGMGEAAVEGLVINTVVNILAAYSKFTDAGLYMDRALQILEMMRPEGNHIITRWKELGIEAKNSLDSQALIEQYNHFCLKKKCVLCPVGADILRKPTG